MPSIKFNHRAVAALKPQSTRVDYFDSDITGFSVRVAPPDSKTGNVRKTWLLVYRNRDGRLRRMKLGDFPRMPFADARQMAKDLLADVQKGHDPAAVKQTDRDAQTFGDLAREYLERHAAHKRSGHVDARMLNGSEHKKRTGKTPVPGLVKTWGTRKIADIRRAEIRQFLEATAERAPITANRVKALLCKMFNFAIEREWIDANPCAGMRALAKERKRTRVLTRDELRKVWAALDVDGSVIASAFKLQLLTAQRGGEVVGMRWSEVDLDAAEWTIPEERSKNKLPHVVPLSASALTLVRERKSAQAESPTPWVFPSPWTKLKAKPMTHRQKAIARLRKLSGVAFRGHDLRRTAATMMAEAGVPESVIPKVLNHMEPGVTRQHYNLHAYVQEKRDALDRWASRLERILTTDPASTVLEFPQAATGA